VGQLCPLLTRTGGAVRILFYLTCCECIRSVDPPPPLTTHTFNVHASPRISLDGKVVCIATTNTSHPSSSSSTSKQAPHPLTVDLHHTHMHLYRVSCVSLGHSVVLFQQPAAQHLGFDHSNRIAITKRVEEAERPRGLVMAARIQASIRMDGCIAPGSQGNAKVVKHSTR
jgi:hypothetical protein